MAALVEREIRKQLLGGGQEPVKGPLLICNNPAILKISTR